jgi:hypothetical protein
MQSKDIKTTDTLRSRVWDIRRERYLDASDCFVACTGDILEIGGDMIDINPHFIVEPCTGYIAREGKLVYQSDVITLQWDLGTYKVEWNKEKGYWSFTGIDNDRVLGFYSALPFNVLGTMHEFDYQDMEKEYKEQI